MLLVEIDQSQVSKLVMCTMFPPGRVHYQQPATPEVKRQWELLILEYLIEHIPPFGSCLFEITSKMKIIKVCDLRPELLRELLRLLLDDGGVFDREGSVEFEPVVLWAVDDVCFVWVEEVITQMGYDRILLYAFE